MRKTVCLLLVLVMTGMLLTGCGKLGKLQNTWEYKLDIAPMILETLHMDALGEELGMGPLELTVQLTFREDGSFCVGFAHQKIVEIVSQLVKKLEQKLLDALQEKLTEKLDESGLSVDMGNLLGSSGLEFGDLTEKLTENFDQEGFANKLTGNITLEGYYQVKGDKLLFSDDPEIFDEEVYTLFSVEEGTLVLSEHVGENGLIKEHPVLGSAPVTFQKALFALR